MPDPPHHGLVRLATTADAEACAAIYAPYVEHTAITFELVPPGAAEMAGRIEAALAAHAWFVYEHAGRVVGYSYGTRLHTRAAYRWSCEVSVYVEQGQHRAGAGRGLYEALLARLAERGYLRAVAGMTLPNESSVGLHRTMGFTSVGVYRQIGFKLGAWHDVEMTQRSLGTGGQTQEEPAEPR
ncbi:MAG TPA: GNAT family N-acetyltransferase [Solirubrobacteraceae bacterium]